MQKRNDKKVFCVLPFYFCLKCLFLACYGAAKKESGQLTALNQHKN